MATYSCHWVIMGKVEIGNFCCLTADRFVYRNVSWVVIWILSKSKSLNLIACHGNIKGKFSKKYSKIFSSEAVRGMKLKLCIHVHDISLYINWPGAAARSEASSFDPHVRHILSWRLGHENISTAILPLPLIQEEQLSVTGERMCTKYW